jgi:phage FluMu protein Com
MPFLSTVECSCSTQITYYLDKKVPQGTWLEVTCPNDGCKKVNEFRAGGFAEKPIEKGAVPAQVIQTN